MKTSENAMKMFEPTVIQQFKQEDTPFYYYDLKLLRESVAAISKAANRYGYKLHYAMKANALPEILEVIHQAGMGVDCVSGNEVQRAIDLGFIGEDISFAGVGKTDPEIKLGLKHRIFSFNSESVEELEIINQLAEETDTVANIALRLNPNVNAKTHRHITTGLDENKFGINPWNLEDILDKLRNWKNLKLTGIHFHIGSQITDMSVFKGLCLRINELQQWFVDHRILLEHINVGGGLGLNYQQPDREAVPDFNSYFRMFHEFLDLRPDQSLHFEPGRAVVAQCGSLITRIIYVKQGAKTQFAIVDAGMNDLIRPALYQAYHKIENLTSDKPPQKYDVVGPVCESADCFGKAVSLNESQRGDILAIRSAGAYGQVMASTYNLRDLIPARFSS